MNTSDYQAELDYLEREAREEGRNEFPDDDEASEAAREDARDSTYR